MADCQTEMSRTDSKKVSNRRGEKRKSDTPKQSKTLKIKNYVLPLSDREEIVFYPLPREILRQYEGDVTSCMRIARCLYEAQRFYDSCVRELDLITNEN